MTGQGSVRSVTPGKHQPIFFGFLQKKQACPQRSQLFLIDPAETRWYKERESLSDDQPSAEPVFIPEGGTAL